MLRHNNFRRFGTPMHLLLVRIPARSAAANMPTIPVATQAIGPTRPANRSPPRPQTLTAPVPPVKRSNWNSAHRDSVRSSSFFMLAVDLEHQVEGTARRDDAQVAVEDKQRIDHDPRRSALCLSLGLGLGQPAHNEALKIDVRDLIWVEFELGRKRRQIRREPLVKPDNVSRARQRAPRHVGQPVSCLLDRAKKSPPCS